MSVIEIAVGYSHRIGATRPSTFHNMKVDTDRLVGEFLSRAIALHPYPEVAAQEKSGWALWLITETVDQYLEESLPLSAYGVTHGARVALKGPPLKITVMCAKTVYIDPQDSTAGVIEQTLKSFRQLDQEYTGFMLMKTNYNMANESTDISEDVLPTYNHCCLVVDCKCPNYQQAIDNRKLRRQRSSSMNDLASGIYSLEDDENFKKNKLEGKLQEHILCSFCEHPRYCHFIEPYNQKSAIEKLDLFKSIDLSDIFNGETFFLKSRSVEDAPGVPVYQRLKKLASASLLQDKRQSWTDKTTFSRERSSTESSLSDSPRKTQSKSPRKDSPRAGPLKKWAVRMRNIKNQNEELQQTKVFGVDLAKVMQREKEHGPVPLAIMSMLEYIELHGLNSVGIYRTSGSFEVGVTLRKMVDDTKDGNYDFGTNDVYAVGDMVKAYLSQLPEPLLTFSLLNRFLAAAQCSARDLKLHYLKGLLGALPIENYRFLCYLNDHLKKVAAFSATNKMSIENLAICFGPLYLRSRNDGFNVDEVAAHQKKVADVVFTIITESETLFSSSDFATLKSIVALSDYAAEDYEDAVIRRGDIVHIFYIKGQECLGEVKGDIVKFQIATEVQPDENLITTTKKPKKKEKMLPKLDFGKLSARSHSITELSFISRTNSDSSLTHTNSSSSNLSASSSSSSFVPTKSVALKYRLLPPGFDPKNFEMALDEPDFDKIFAMSKAQFLAMPEWKRQDKVEEHYKEIEELITSKKEGSTPRTLLATSPGRKTSPHSPKKE